jgi:ribonuclease BN (tRNA processing enzyme)
MPTEVVPYCGGALQVGPFMLRLRGQRHPGGSVGVRVDDLLAYVTDTVTDPGSEELARGVDLLLHEVWRTDAEAAVEDPGASGHAAAGPVADLAERAGVRRLAPVHHPPQRDGAALRALCDDMAAGRRLRVIPLDEGEELALG